MTMCWRGEKTCLVPLDKDKHLGNAVEWMNDPVVTRNMTAGDMPISRVAEEEFFDRQLQGSEKEIVLAIELHDGEHIGMAGIHDINYRHGTATTGIVIGRQDLWGQGLGLDAMKIRTRYAFEILGLRLLLSDVFAENTNSLKALRKVGYRDAGITPRRYWKRGQYRDMVNLYLENDMVNWADDGE